MVKDQGTTAGLYTVDVPRERMFSIDVHVTWSNVKLLVLSSQYVMTLQFLLIL